MSPASTSPSPMQGPEPLRLLHVGERGMHARLRSCLAGGTPPPHLEHSAALPTPLPEVDVLLLDEALLEDSRAGSRAVEIMAAADQRVPVVLVRHDPPAPADMAAAMRRGAEDLICLDADNSVELVGRLAAAATRHLARHELRARATDAEDGEARFQRMVQANADGVMIVSREGDIRYVNGAAEALFNRSAARLLGEPFGAPLVSGLTTELDVVLPEGRTTVVELRVVDIPWEGCTAHLVSLRDITDRRAAEERSVDLAREQEARRQAEAAEAEARLLADVGDILDASLNLSGTLQGLPRALVPRLADWCVVDLLEDAGEPRRFGAVAERGKQAQLDRLLNDHPLRRDSEQPAARALRRDTPFFLREVPGEFAATAGLDAEHADLLAGLGMASLIAVPLPAPEGAAGVLTLVRAGEKRYGQGDVRLAEDVARRAGHAVERVRLFREAQAANKAKADFLAIMSHELRTPLNSIMGYVDLLQAGIAGELSGDQLAKMGRIKLSATHLLQLIEEILSYSRMEAGRERLRPEQATLREVLNEVAALTEPLATEQGLRFRVGRSPEVELFTDVAKVRQVLLNLITNAVKFTEEGEVCLEAEEIGERVRIMVRDTGPGIEPDHLERIFEPFWQVEQPQTRRTGGTGLGLSVARRLARLLGGELVGRSEPGEGSVFILEFPRHLPDPEPGHDAELLHDPFEDRERAGGG